MTKYGNLTDAEIQGKIRSLMLTNAGIGVVGTAVGFVYANRTGGGFWRYVGFGLLGGMITGAITYFTTYQSINSYATELEARKQRKLGAVVETEEKPKAV